MTDLRPDILPENPAEHIRIAPPLAHPRRYYLRQLLGLVLFARDHHLPTPAPETRLRLADYGCGTKPYLSLFDPARVEYLGLDLAWNPHADVIIGSDSIIQLPDNQMDVVLSTQVLEHVEDPDGYLREACRILRPEGRLLLTTHGHWMYHPDPTDYWRWTSAGLRKVVERNGFEVLAFRGMMGRAATGLQLFQDGFLFKLPPWLRPAWALLMQAAIQLTDKIGSQASIDADACTYLVVARKVPIPA